MKTNHHRRISVVLMALMVLVWAASAVMADDRMPESAANTRARLDIDSLAMEEIQLTIQTKEHYKIRTKIWVFTVADQTEFVTKKGDLISFKDLKVPCRAVIQYELSEGIQINPVAWRANIQKVSKGATDEFSEPEPY